MKDKSLKILSSFEKILLFIAVFCFISIVINQFIFNKEMLDVIITDNENIIPIEESMNYINNGEVALLVSCKQPYELLINGEAIDTNLDNDISYIKVYDNDVVELYIKKNKVNKNTTVKIISVSNNIIQPNINEYYPCVGGINYLFKVEIENRT